MNKIENAINDLKNGKAIVVVDDYDREFEGDLVFAAEKASEENLCFAMLHARGLMCLPCNGEILDRLKIPMMVEHTTDPFETPFTISIDGIKTTTGMSVTDRLNTISVLLGEHSKPEDLKRPGHLFPLRARKALLKERRGHTEASIELMKLCQFKEVAVIIEIMKPNGQMAKGVDLEEFAKTHQLSLISVEEIYDHVYNKSI